MKTNKIMNPEEKANHLCARILNVLDGAEVDYTCIIGIALINVDEIISTKRLCYTAFEDDFLLPTDLKYWELVREYLRGML